MKLILNEAKKNEFTVIHIKEAQDKIKLEEYEIISN